MPDGTEYPIDTPYDFNCDFCGNSILYGDTFWTYPAKHICGDINIETHFHERCLTENQKADNKVSIDEYIRKNPDDWTINPEYRKMMNEIKKHVDDNSK